MRQQNQFQFSMWRSNIMALQETILDALRKNCEVRFSYDPIRRSIQVQTRFGGTPALYTQNEVMLLKEFYIQVNRDRALELMVERGVESIDRYRSSKKPDD